MILIFFPDELRLKKENEDYCKDSLLDISIKVNDKKVISKLFDKGNVIPFQITFTSWIEK